MRITQANMFRIGSNNEFDLYFARAALEEMEQGSVDSRRGSLPIAPPMQLIIKESSGPRRAASCKYPNRQRRKGGSVSPRERDGTPAKTLPEHETLLTAEDAELNNIINVNSATPMQLAPPPQLDPTHLAPGPRLDFKCHSAPHSRNASWKKGKRPQSNKFSDDSPGEARPRTGSVPFEDSISARLEQLRLLQAEDCCVVRNFATTSKGLINRGDSFKRKSISVASDAGSSGLGEGETIPISHSPEGSTGASSSTAPVSKVLVVGSHGVGKTALVHQFMTSEYMGAMETSFDDHSEKTVSVLLDGEETMVDMYDVPSESDHLLVEEVEAYIVIYSITDRASFVHAEDILREIRSEKEHHPAIILVANKSDLVRSRQITADEGRELCLQRDCKYIEVSAALNHKVDELLVGVVSQIRLSPQRLDKWKNRASSQDEHEHDITCTGGAKGFLQKIFKRQQFHVSKSCDNLLVL